MMYHTVMIFPTFWGAGSHPTPYGPNFENPIIKVAQVTKMYCHKPHKIFAMAKSLGEVQSYFSAALYNIIPERNALLFW